MSIVRLFFKNVNLGLRTGVYGGGFGQAVAVVIMVVALFVGLSVATGNLTGEQLVADPWGSVVRAFEPTVQSLFHTGSDSAVPQP